MATEDSSPQSGELPGLIDILLPEIPWVSEAVERAHNNLPDLGFAKVPVITPEDLIIAESYAAQNSPDRFQDLDDLKHLFLRVSDLDTDYIRRKLQLLGLPIPLPVLSFAPESLR